MDDTELYVVAKGTNILWVGATEDLVSEPMSRARFRLALDCADRVYRLPEDVQDNRLATILDLEGAAPAADANAQAA